MSPNFLQYSKSRISLLIRPALSVSEKFPTYPQPQIIMFFYYFYLLFLDRKIVFVLL